MNFFTKFVCVFICVFSWKSFSSEDNLVLRTQEDHPAYENNYNCNPDSKYYDFCRKKKILKDFTQYIEAQKERSEEDNWIKKIVKNCETAFEGWLNNMSLGVPR